MRIKCLTFNPRGTIDPASAVPISIAPGVRAASPYPPGNVAVNGDSWPDGKTYTGDVTLSWAHRNRTMQSGIVAQDAPSVGTPEGTYTVDVLIDGIVKRMATGIAGTSFVYSHANRVADDPDLLKTVAFRITPANGTFTGTARTTDTFVMS